MHILLTICVSLRDLYSSGENDYLSVAPHDSKSDAARTPSSERGAVWARLSRRPRKPNPRYWYPAYVKGADFVMHAN